MEKKTSRLTSVSMANEVKQLLGTHYPQTLFSIDVKSFRKKLYANIHWEDSVPKPEVKRILTPVAGHYDALLTVTRSISDATLGRMVREMHCWEVIQEASERMQDVYLH